MFGLAGESASSEHSSEVSCQDFRSLRWQSKQRLLCWPNNNVYWAPTRLSSPYRVFSAKGIRDDFYTKCLSWGVEHIALTFENNLLFFNPSQSQRGTAIFKVSNACEECYETESGSSREEYVPSLSLSTSEQSISESHFSPLYSSKPYPTAVAFSRVSDAAVFVGLSSGNALLCETTPSGTFVCRQRFTVPTPTFDNELTGFFTPPTSPLPALDNRLAYMHHSSTYRELYSQLLMSMTSITSAETCSHHTFLAALSTSSGELLLLDSRQTRPCAVICNTPEQLQPVITNSSSSSPLTHLSSESSPTSSSLLWQSQHNSTTCEDAHNVDRCAKERVARTANFTRCRDRLCSTSWNCNGSLIATGSGSGKVHIYALSNLSRPVHSLTTSQDTSIKALCFHPCNPHELVFNTHPHTGHSLRIYDISGNLPLITWASYVETSVIQVSYSPDGCYLLTTHDKIWNKNDYELSKQKYTVLKTEHETSSDIKRELRDKEKYYLLECEERSEQQQQQQQQEQTEEYELEWEEEELEEEEVREKNNKMSIDAKQNRKQIQSLLSQKIFKWPLQSKQLSLTHEQYSNKKLEEWSTNDYDDCENESMPLWGNNIDEYNESITNTYCKSNKTIANTHLCEKSAKVKSLIAQHTQQIHTTCAIPSYSLVVWKRGQHLHKSRAQSELLSYVPQYEKLMYEHSVLSENMLSLSSNEQEHLPRALIPKYAMSGHHERPLLLTTSYKPPTQTCSYVSVAAGTDQRMRFWRVFEMQSRSCIKENVSEMYSDGNSINAKHNKSNNYKNYNDYHNFAANNQSKYVIDNYTLREKICAVNVSLLEEKNNEQQANKENNN